LRRKAAPSLDAPTTKINLRFDSTTQLFIATGSEKRAELRKSRAGGNTSKYEQL
jgi:hypothetical protein